MRARHGRYGRSGYGSERARRHIEQARAFSTEVGSADDAVKEAFFALSGRALDTLLVDYGRRYGEAAEAYARETIPKWRAHRVQMSGMVAQRLFALVPPLMPVAQKYRLVEAIWKACGPRSTHYLYLGPDSDAEAVASAIETYFAGLDVRHAIPASLERRFDWLCENDVALKQRLLNHFLEEQRTAAMAAARLNVPMLIATMNGEPMNYVSKLSHTVFVGNHRLEIKADPLRNGFALNASPNAAIKPPTAFPWGLVLVLAGVLLTLFAAGAFRALVR